MPKPQKQDPMERERIGMHVAHDVPWAQYGYREIMRAGGTIEIKHRNGRVFRITVEETK